MSELGRKLAEALPDAKRAWSDERVERVEEAMLRRRARRAVRRGALAALAMIVLVAGSLLWWRRPATLTLADGSTVRLRDRLSVARVRTAGAERTVVELVAGSALFDVTHVEGRLFRVEAGAVAVEVLGTRFIVERSERSVKVAVERGRVRVLGVGPEHLLAAGEILELPSGPLGPTPSAPATPVDAPGPNPNPSPAPAPVPAPVPVPVPVPEFEPGHPGIEAPPTPAAPPTPLVDQPAPRPQRHASPASPAWRAPAEQGDFDRAYRELSRSGPKSVRDVPNELLLAADVTRLSHHPSEAVPLLERVVRDHPKDPRAPLAAFTLGRALLDELGRPQQAAAAFARARALAPTGPLAADALGREVEAWSRAGDTGRARARAEEYLRAYPKGARLSSVRRFGGLE